MYKEEVAEFLGVSIRAVERYTKDKKLTANYEMMPRGGQKAVYDPKEVSALKLQMEMPKIVENKPTRQPDLGVGDVVSGQEQTGLALQGQHFINRFDELASYLIKDKISVDKKLTLSLAEAAQLAGLSKNYLKKAIDGGELKAAKRGKGWNIKRSDLEMWVEGL